MKNRTECRQCGDADCPHRHNVDRQEEVVSALWRFAHSLQHKKATARISDKKSPLNGTAVNLESLGDALKEIMNTFNYGVIPVQ